MTKKTQDMNHASTELFKRKDACGSLGLLNLSLSFDAYSQMQDKHNIQVDNSKSFTEKTQDTKEYQAAFLQILQRITTEYTIDDMILIDTSSNYINSIPKDSPFSKEELEDMARQYILRNWGSNTHGQIVGSIGHIYEEKGCTPITIPKAKG